MRPYIGVDEVQLAIELWQGLRRPDSYRGLAQQLRGIFHRLSAYLIAGAQEKRVGGILEASCGRIGLCEKYVAVKTVCGICRYRFEDGNAFGDLSVQLHD